MRKRKKFYQGVLDIPEGLVGRWEVVHDLRPAGVTFPLATDRTRIMGGDQGGQVTFSQPTRWHRLLENDMVWMSDYPIEQEQCNHALAPIRAGRVLVGGLGLGYAASVLACRRAVREVVVVEFSQEVCRLVAPHLLRATREREKIKVIEADLFQYLRDARRGGELFDHAYYDIWAGDGEETFFSVVCPLLKLSDGPVRYRPVCWNENVMRGQLYHSLISSYHIALSKLSQELGAECSLESLARATGNKWHDWKVPFFRWVLEAHPSDQQREAGMRGYAGGYGCPYFEEWWQSWTHSGRRR